MKAEQEIFAHAMALPSREAREAYLLGACGQNRELRRSVDELLAAFNDAGEIDFLKAAERGPEGRTARMDAPLDEGPGTVIGRYKLLENIGEGGFGVVYVAEQKEPVKRRVALKIIKLGMDTRQVVARFEAERQALALMDHANIAKVLDGGATDAGRPYFVMELVRGIPITQYCDRNALPPVERLELFLQVCRAIQHAHQKGIIHRDIKPSNILVSPHDGVPVCKVIDFGIAKATQGELTDKTVYTQFQQFIGTPAYMSPEQAEISGLDVDTRSDIYSLGVLLYELLVGKTPFDPQELLASGLDEMRRTIREKEPLRPSTRLSSMVGEELTTTARCRAADASKLISLLRGDLDWIAMKCLEKDRTRRYETANGLARDIERHLNNEPVVARPASSVYRLQKLVRRNKVTFAAVMAVTVALVLGVVVSFWQAVRAKEAEHHAQVEARRASAESVRAQAAEKTAIEKSQIAEQQRQRANQGELSARQQGYASDINLAQQALTMNNLGRAQELLNRHRPQPGQKDLRGWEWRHLWQRCQSEAQSVVCQRSNAIVSLAVSHDGKWLAVGEEHNGGLSVWDLRKGLEIARLPAGEGGVHVAFSTCEPMLAFSSEAGLGTTNHQYCVRLWNGATKQIAGELPLSGACGGLAFSEDGQTLVTTTWEPDNQVTLWRVSEKRTLATYPAFLVPDDIGTPFAMARDLSLAAHATRRLDSGCGCPDSVRILDLATGQERWSKKVADERLTALALSPDGKTLATGGAYVESAIRLWDVSNGQEIGRLEGHRSWVSALLFWPDGKTLASASADQTIGLWDLSTRQLKATLRGHTREVWRLALLPDTRTLASGCVDGSVCLWDTAASQRESGRLTLPTSVTAWRFAPDSKSVVALGAEGQVMRWKGTDFQQSERLIGVGTALVGWGSLSRRYGGGLFSQDCRLLACRTTNHTVQVWDLAERALLREFRVPKPLIPGRFLAQGKRLLTVDDEGGVLRLWDVAAGQEARFPGGSESVGPGARGAIALSPDEQWCLAFGNRSGAVLLDMIRGRAINPKLDVTKVVGAEYSPDGKLLALAGESGFAMLYDAGSLRQVATLGGYLLSPRSVAFSPDGRRLATGGDGPQALKLWDLDSHENLLTLEGQGSLFWDTAFSPDGDIIGSAGEASSALHLWRAPSWAEIEAAEKAQARAASR